MNETNKLAMIAATSMECLALQEKRDIVDEG